MIKNQVVLRNLQDEKQAEQTAATSQEVQRKAEIALKAATTGTSTTAISGDAALTGILDIAIAELTLTRHLGRNANFRRPQRNCKSELDPRLTTSSGWASRWPWRCG